MRYMYVYLNVPFKFLVSDAPNNGSLQSPLCAAASSKQLQSSPLLLRLAVPTHETNVTLLRY